MTGIEKVMAIKRRLGSLNYPVNIYCFYCDRSRNYFHEGYGAAGYQIENLKVWLVFEGKYVSLNVKYVIEREVRTWTQSMQSNKRLFLNVKRVLEHKLCICVTTIDRKSYEGYDGAGYSFFYQLTPLVIIKSKIWRFGSFLKVERHFEREVRNLAWITYLLTYSNQKYAIKQKFRRYSHIKRVGTWT